MNVEDNDELFYSEFQNKNIPGISREILCLASGNSRPGIFNNGPSRETLHKIHTFHTFPKYFLEFSVNIQITM